LFAALSLRLLAPALHKAGFKHVSLFEKARSFAEASPALHSGGVVLAANGVRVLDHLALAEPLYQFGNPILKVESVTHANHKMTSYSPEVLVHQRARHVAPLSGSEKPPMLTSIAIHGKRLHEALSLTLPKQVRVHFNTPISKVERKGEQKQDDNKKNDRSLDDDADVSESEAQQRNSVALSTTVTHVSLDDVSSVG
jgi:2-polyprenyl-6-methoxyphenol hydroxylase-like FAD-dependent oxidoreductase